MNEKNKKLLSKINKDKRKSSLEKIKKKKRRELSLIVLLFLTVILGVGFMFSSYVKLKTINVSGENQITKDEILAAGNINSNLKTWTIKDDEVRNNIKNKYSIFKEVTVKSTFPSKIDIKVEEYRFIAKNKKTDGQIEIIMENGRTYSGQVRNNYNLPILENFKEDEEKLKEITTLILSPNIAPWLLRQDLPKLGFYLVKEALVEENGHNYEILLFHRGKGNSLTKEQIYFGQFLPYLPEARDYFLKRKQKDFHKIACMEKTKNQDLVKSEIDRLKQLWKWWEND